MSSTATISKIKNRYLLLRWMETALFGLAAGAIAGAICFVFELPMFFVVVPAIITIAWRYYSLDLPHVDDLRIALYLNRFYPELKDSCDLFVKEPGQLTTLEKIQLERISVPQVKLPHKLPYAITAVVFAFGILGITIYVVSAIFFIQQSIGPFTHQESNPAPSLDPSIKSVTINITPPPYTNLAKTETSNLSFSTVEGSLVTWSISFHQPVFHIKLTMTGGDSLVATPPSTHSSQPITFSYVPSTSFLYRITWTINGENHSSDYNRIDVKPDNIPAVAIKDLPQFTRLKWGEKNSIEVNSVLQDDYGLTEGHVVATVAKGSGESVKFREEKLPFTSPSKVSGTRITGKLTLDFRKLGIDPGDEVYFYVEAFDNKRPQSQRNRTDTYFVALQDTTQQEMVMNEGLGVDLMPDYFRSQRQLIIDTEKLLAGQKAKKVTMQQFNSTSNELGYDQKVLRLRYGQFLGEEFETSIGESAAEETHDDGENKGDDVLKQFGHQHDTENEHNLVADKKAKDKEEDPLAAYRHDHDTEEEATFFTQSIKAKLRAALTLMWDSELKLRMFTPKESLPTQYQILKLLKEISQDSRIYVHRMGFDPPPIKEERRLTGSLDEVKPAGIENQATTGYQYPAIRLALSDISNALLSENIKLNEQQRSNLHSAGDELAALALKFPGNYLQALSDLKFVAEDKSNSTEIRPQLEEIQKVLWTVLPNEAPSPTRRSAGAHSLDVKFLEEIKAKAND
ncbi:MAG TPA: hypothetical protein VF473_02465 [Cyclobacteriaceae bacterium]